MKYLSKLLSVLLMGVMLYSTGCADYDEDIKTIQNQLNQLVSGEIQPLKADLAKVKSDLEAAIAAAQAELKNIHDVDIANLKAADAALDAKIGVANDKILDLEEALNEEVKALEADITALNAAIEAAKQAAKDGDAALKSELEKQIAALNTELSTKLATLEATLNGDIAKLREDAEKAIAEANAAIDAVEARATALEAADAEFAKELETIKADIKKLNEDLAAKYDEMVKAVENLQGQVTENANDIAALEENLTKLSETVDGINTKLAEHLVAYATFEAATNGKIASIEEQIEGINGAIETINGTLEDLQKQIDDNDADIEDIYSQIELLIKADAAMNEAIGALETDLATFKADLETELTKAFGDVWDNIDAVKGDLSSFKRDMKGQLTAAAAALSKLNDALEAEKMNRTAKDNQLTAQLENLQKELETQVEALNLRADAIEAAYKAADEQLQKNLDAAVETLNQAIADAIDESKAYTDEEIAELKAQLTDQHKKDITALNDRIDEKVKTLEEKIQAAWEDLNGAINCLNKAVAGLQEQVKVNAEQIDAILNRVQSVVYIPDYSDGKATVEWAAVGQTVVEGTSSIKYQVYPAECAAALAEAWNNADEDLKSFLTFDWTGVAVRSEETSFDIVAVEADEEGVLYIDFEARGLADDFYLNGPQAGEGYSISLVVANENANLSSCYTNVVANTDSFELTPGLFYEVAGKMEPAPEWIDHANVDYEIPYTDKAVRKLMEGLVLRYVDADGAFYTWYELADMGYEVERPEFMFKGAYEPNEDARAYFNYNVALTNGKLDIGFAAGTFAEGEYLWEKWINSLQIAQQDPTIGFAPRVNLTEAATAESVGAVLGATVRYLASGVELNTGEVVKIGKAIGEAAGTAADIAWTFAEDAEIDAAIFGGDAEAAYSRAAVAVTIDEENAQLHDFAGKYSAFIDSAVAAAVVEVAEDGTETAADDVVATLAADDEENVTLAIENFAWDKTYKLTFVYELDAIDITVEVLVNTIDRNRDVVTLSMETSTEYTHEPNILATAESNKAFGIEEFISLGDVYDKIVALNAETPVVYPSKEEFEKSVFVDNNFEDPKKVTVVNDLHFFGGKDSRVEGKYQLAQILGLAFLKMDNTGENLDLNLYVQFGKSNWNKGAVEYIKFSQKYYTWYGQEIQVMYTLNFDVPTKYDFVHSDAFVFSDNGYYSNVKPFYQTYADGKKFADTYTKAILTFSVYEVDMDAAFRVVEKDKEGNIVRYLTADDLAAEHLTATFDFVEEPKDANIVFNGNKLSYNGKDESVRVAGKLLMSGEVELPTSFDEGKTYAEYKVNQFNPLCDLSVNPDAPKYIEVTESQVYTIDAIDYFDLFEAREGNKTAYVWADGSKVNLIDHNTGAWLLGNGTNGWYKNMTRTDIYGLTSEFKLISEIPAEYAQYFTWNETTGELTFNAKNQLQMANPIDVTIEMSVELPWAENKPAEVTITFGPKKVLDEGVVPAE